MTKKTWNVAVVGAVGMVGTEMIRTLEERHFPVDELRPLDVAEFEGTEVRFRGQAIRCQTASGKAFEGIDLAIFGSTQAPNLHYCEWIRGWTHTCLEIYGELAEKNPAFLAQFDDEPTKKVS